MPTWINTTIPYIQIALAVLLATLILIQNKGAGMSNVFGGDGNVYSTRRGAERMIFIVTIVVAVLFFSTALLNAAI